MIHPLYVYNLFYFCKQLQLVRYHLPNDINVANLNCIKYIYIYPKQYFIGKVGIQMDKTNK